MTAALARGRRSYTTTRDTIIVFATSAYYGRASQPVWDWIKTKLETRNA